MDDLTTAEVIPFDINVTLDESLSKDGSREGLWLVEHLKDLADTMEQRATSAEGSLSSRRDGLTGLRDAAANLEGTAAIYRLLMAHPGSASVSLSDVLGHAFAAVMDTLNLRERTNFTFYCEPGCLVSPAKALSIGTIVVEVVTNALRHAHPSGITGQLDVACRRSGDRHVLEIADDGVGLPEGFDHEEDSGVGLKAVKQIAEDIGAECEFHSTPLGFTFRLLIPANVA